MKKPIQQSQTSAPTQIPPTTADEGKAPSTSNDATVNGPSDIGKLEPTIDQENKTK